MIGKAVVVVPLRSLTGGKTRLAPVLDRSDRTAMTERMFRTVMKAALGSHMGAPEVLVVSPDPAALELATSLGQRVRALREDDAADGLNGALQQATAVVSDAGAGSVLILPADLPLLTPADVDNLLRRDAPVVVAPDRHGRGTNALLVRLHGPGREFRYQFGEASYDRHIDEAHRLGLDAATAVAMGMSFDLDTPEDLVLLQTLDEAYDAPPLEGIRRVS